MANRGFLARHKIVRNAIKKDMLYFAVPAILVLTAGVSLSAWDQVRHHGSLYILSVQSVFGAALLVFGLTTMIVAQITLFRFYSSTLVIRVGHKLITHGIYKFVRHPIYLGCIIALMWGIPIYCSSLYGFLIMSVLIPIFLNRIRMEERLLTDEFGDKYRAYKEAVKKLIPFIY